MGEWGWSCRGGWGCAGCSVLWARLSPGDLLLLHIRPDSALMEGGSQAPTDCTNSRIWPFPAFSLSFQANVSGWVGKVSRGDQLNVYPPLWHGNAASTLIFMPSDILQLAAASPLPACSPSPHLWHGSGGERGDIAPAQLPPCSPWAKHPCLTAEGMEGSSVGQKPG